MIPTPNPQLLNKLTNQTVIQKLNLKITAKNLTIAITKNQINPPLNTTKNIETL